jgi:hypothetical protein
MVTRKNAHNVILELQTLVCPKLENWKPPWNYVGNWQGDPYDSSDEEWCTSLNVLVATWKGKESSFRVEVDANVDIGSLIHDVFVVGDMVHDEHRKEVEEIGIDGGPMPRTQDGLETHGNKNMDDV